MQRLKLLSEADRNVFNVTFAFVNGRLSEQSTIDWALGVPKGDIAKRFALLDVLSHQDVEGLTEPWRTAWRVIEEAWVVEQPESSRDSHDAFMVGQRVRAGERTGALIASMVALVRPRVHASALSSLDHHYRRRTRRPRELHDILSVSLESGDIVDPAEIGLDAIHEKTFLIELVDELDGAVTSGLSVGRRLLGFTDERPWRLGQLRRAYFVPEGARRSNEHEPDLFGSGIAPSAKLLHSSLIRLSVVDPTAAMAVMNRWTSMQDFVHVRLWAAAAREQRLVRPTDVASFLLRANDRQFWDLHQFPEIAELRAVRFSELDGSDQHLLLKRLRRGPPARHWPRNADAQAVRTARSFWTTRELRRIQIAGGVLGDIERGWLETGLIDQPELGAMYRLDEGFLGTSEASWVPPRPSETFEFLEGRLRLEALEASLQAKRGHWDNDPARGAADWIRAAGNATRVIADFESAGGGAFCPMVWETFAWHHSPKQPETAESDAIGGDTEADRVADLIVLLPEKTLAIAIQGLSRWLDTWASHIALRHKFALVWNRLWPAAVVATDAEQRSPDELSLSEVVQSSDEGEPQDLDTLNTPAGRLVGAFLSACPRLSESSGNPFDESALRGMRNAIIAVGGRSGLVVRHRLIEQAAYFLRADSEWTKANLLSPLLEDSQHSVVLWRAVARRTRFGDVMQILGEEMARRSFDVRLGRGSRSSLSFSVLVEVMHALREKRDPLVSIASTQQMIRSLDDEVRAHAANVVQRYVKDMTTPNADVHDPLSPESLFVSSAKPFLERVWPQERSLSTPGVSRAFADLPYACRGRFADAVAAIERFLVPFDAWSLADYGLRGSVGDSTRIASVDSPEKAAALLLLLDMTISRADNAVVPIDLPVALGRIAELAPLLQEKATFRRLAALSRR